MVKFKALLDGWKEKAVPAKTESSYAVRLPLGDAARLHALADMFPGRAVEDIITDLLHVALDEVAESMPYERGPKVISQDDHGDPVYEDIGMTPRFLELSRKYKKSLQAN
jgi:hypothetical protein